jgi:colicin import membrane protein
MITTKEDMKLRIFKAADTFNSAGQKPTLEKIRSSIGGGSFTTISAILSEWKTQSTTRVSTSREPAPEALSSKISDLGAEIWTIALEISNDRFAVERSLMEQSRTTLENEKMEALRLADELTLKIESQEIDLATANAKILSIKTDSDAIFSQLMAEEKSSAAKSGKIQESDKRIDDLTHALEISYQQSNLLLSSLTELSKKTNSSFDSSQLTQS